jgi:hypothetical protein
MSIQEAARSGAAICARSSIQRAGMPALNRRAENHENGCHGASGDVFEK